MIQTTTQSYLNFRDLHQEISVLPILMEQEKVYLPDGILQGSWPTGAALRELPTLRCCHFRVNYCIANGTSGEVGKWVDLEM